MLQSQENGDERKQDDFFYRSCDFAFLGEWLQYFSS